MVHAVHVPPPQTWPEPQLVPSGTAVPVSVQTGVPLPHPIAPNWHGFVGAQAAPGEQEVPATGEDWDEGEAPQPARMRAHPSHARTATVSAPERRIPPPRCPLRI